ncbi:tyrosine-type recombinase/integrase [Micromonospora thermarum]|uniref:Tyrosine-type recombinase/integrase n=1 Tax=Micromonospora thermarum TaxID=2720024 RepID=A0ABX0Z6B3_9ACTN|nr:tyrosine-type recombinase/integrase [Micromonospora thermarum]NJP31954.1 tyrosine-type recombinase/integrase [Micromonospora thermarum]
MARPELPIGTWGEIRTQRLGPDRFRARARFRDYDGKTRDIEATDTTGPAAERALKVKLRGRTTPNDDEITRETRVSRLAEVWVEEITAEERIAPQTIQRYQTSLRTAILPALGDLRIREASVGRLDRFLRDIAKDRPSAAKGTKVVLGQMFALAERHGAIPTNPLRDTGQQREPRRKVVALTDEHLHAVRAAIREWQRPVPGKPGPRHTGDLADIVDLMLATGARIGEILALRWEDLDLAAERPTLTICGTLVSVKGQGFFRQPWTKSDAGYRMVVLPRFAVGVLLARKLVTADNPHDAIFASRRGTWLAPNNVRRQWRQARADTDLDWVTPHAFRRTVATTLASAMPGEESVLGLAQPGGEVVDGQ